ncbi:MAG TPA: iron donor protein CyaY [Magnetospirillum sp.]|nr:iron donor protein CyaY [Magnetospirillum sp.]
MTLDERRFAALADEVLEQLGDAVDDALGDEIDVDLQAGILTLSLSGGGQYIINKHAPNREIWMSSPVSGAIHFACRDGRWVSTRQPDLVLHEVLAQELKGRYGVAPQI